MTSRETKKEISCRITRTLLLYVRANNQGALGDLLEGLPHDEAFLMDINNWISHVLLQRLYGRMVRILDDPQAVYNMSLASGRMKTPGILDQVTKLLGNPRLIMSYAPRYNTFLKQIGTVKLLALHSNWAIVEDRYHDPAQKTRHDCDCTRGVLAGMPTLLGLPVAHVEELRCQVAENAYGHRVWPDKPPQNSEACRYRVKWQGPRLSFWRRWLTPRLYRHAIDDLVEANQLIQEKYDEVRHLANNLELVNRQLTDSKAQLEIQKEQLQESEKQYRLLAENATDTIWIFNLETMAIDYVSPSVERMRGFTQQEAAAMGLENTLSPASLAHVHEVLSEELGMDGKPGVDPRRSRTVEIEHSRKDGTYGWAEVTVSFIRDVSGSPTGLLGVSRDINARKAAETEKARLEKQLEQARKMEAIGTLSAGIAHDFNNLLMGVLGNTSLMILESDRSTADRERLVHIESYVQRGVDLTKQLLGLAQGGKYEIRPTDLNRLIDSSLTLFGRTRKELSIGTRFETPLWAVAVDQGQIEQVLLNLFINAWQAMPEGGELVVTTENAHIVEDAPKAGLVPPGRYVKVTIRDSGVGMDEVTRSQIFDPFFTTREMGRGAGLGLASAYGIVKNHNGIIEVNSTPGKGTTISILLPATHEQPVVETHKTMGDLPLGSERVLLVDDEEMILDVGHKILDRLGYRVTTVQSGPEAVEALARDPSAFDLVILDMVMPGMSGGEVFDRLRELVPDLKVLLSSGYSASGQAAKVLHRGCAGFIQKPFKIVELAQKLREVLD